jgi:prevent-host-death family protein
MAEIRVGTRELKNRLSEYLRKVKAGETIIVTERGKIIGQIVPLKPSLDERMQALIEAGIADWNMQKLEPYQPSAINTGEGQLSDLVIEDRR